MKQSGKPANAIVDDWYQSYLNAAIQSMGKLGAELVTHARKIPKHIGFEDHTGNLRSSIGFKLFVDGKEVMKDYQVVLNGEKGWTRGQMLANEVGRQCKENQIMLVVTAGMEYAIYVESKGRDVITSAESMAIEKMPELKRRIYEMIENATKGNQQW